jgi:Putative MetA-pathway of phenol degradation
VKLAIFIAALAALPLFADDLINADRPGIADGSTTVGRGTVQLELGAERDDFSDTHALSTPLLLRYGLASDLELRVETEGWEHTPSGSGFNPVSAGVKWHVFDKPSLGLIARVFPKSGSGAFRSDRTAADLRLAADINLGQKWSLNPNIGVAREETTEGTAALTVQYNISERLNVFADGGWQSHALNVDAGTAYIVGRHTQLDFSVGWGAHGAGLPRVWWAAGIARRF